MENRHYLLQDSSLDNAGPSFRKTYCWVLSGLLTAYGVGLVVYGVLAAMVETNGWFLVQVVPFGLLLSGSGACLAILLRMPRIPNRTVSGHDSD